MKYVAMALFLLIALPVKAETIKIPVMCGPTQDYLEVIRDEYREEMVWMSEGKAQNGSGVLYNSLWVNMKTQTWSFLVTNKKNETTCVFASGKTFAFFEPGESI